MVALVAEEENHRNEVSDCRKYARSEKLGQAEEMANQKYRKKYWTRRH